MILKKFFFKNKLRKMITLPAFWKTVKPLFPPFEFTTNTQYK